MHLHGIIICPSSGQRLYSCTFVSQEDFEDHNNIKSYWLLRAMRGNPIMHLGLFLNIRLL